MLLTACLTVRVQYLTCLIDFTNCYFAVSQTCVKIRKRKTKLSHGKCSHYRECQHAAKAQLVLAAELRLTKFWFMVFRFQWRRACPAREVTRRMLHRVTFFAVRTDFDDHVVKGVLLSWKWFLQPFTSCRPDKHSAMFKNSTKRYENWTQFYSFCWYS